MKLSITTATLVQVLLHVIHVVSNPRAAFNFNCEPLTADILERGLQTPLVAARGGEAEAPSGELELCRGHRRLRCLETIAEENSERFAELFPEGIPVLVYDDLKREEIEELKVDDGNTQPLGSKFEVLNCALSLFNAGATESTVANALNGLLDRVVGKISPKQAKEIKALDAKVKDGEMSEMAKDQEVEKIILAARRGTIQNIKKICRLPECVRLTYYKVVAGENPEGHEDYLPRLTNGQVDKLYEAFQEDRNDSDQNANLKVGGTAFWKQWASICKNQQKERKPGTPRPKAMARKDLEEIVKVLESTTVRDVIGGILDVTKKFDFNAAARFVYIAELVRDNDPGFWEEVEKRADEIEKDIIAKGKAQGESDANSELDD